MQQGLHALCHYLPRPRHAAMSATYRLVTTLPVCEAIDVAFAQTNAISDVSRRDDAGLLKVRTQT